MICEKFDDTTKDVSRETAERYFASHPVPRPEEEAKRASIDMPPDCHMTAWSDVPLKKHKKNELILSMSHVCRSWRVCMIGLKRIWREIAFDAETEPASIHLAAFFLTMVEGDDIPIQIYARFTFGDSPDPALRPLLSKLREQIHRWEAFLCWGRLGPYRSYLDLPAPALRSFSDDHDLSHLYSGQIQLFAGQVPILRSLVTSALGSWQSATLIHLNTIDLWDCKARLSVRSLLDFFRRTPQLEKINIVSPNPPIRDCSPSEVINLLHLKEIKIHNPDFYSIVGHLAIPNARVVALYSVYTRGASGNQVRLTFRDPYQFAGFTSMGTPLLSRGIVFASLHVQNTPSDFTFAISTVTEMGMSLCVSLQWATRIDIGSWIEYIERSINTLARMDFRPGTTLQITVEGCTTDYSPLLRLSAVEYFSVECQDPSDILKFLDCCQTPALPNLKSLFAPEVELDEKMTKFLLIFLQSRRNLVVVFYIDNYRALVRTLADYCVIEGGLVFLEMNCAAETFIHRGRDSSA